MLAYIHPDVEWRPAQGPGGMEGNVYRGREAYERWLREELPEVWEEFRGEDLEFRELPGGRVLLLGDIPRPGPGERRSRSARPFGQLARFRDGRVIRIHGFLGPRKLRSKLPGRNLILPMQCLGSDGEGAALT